MAPIKNRASQFQIFTAERCFGSRRKFKIATAMLATMSNQNTSVGHPLWKRNLKASTNGFTRITFSFDHVQGLLNLKLYSRSMSRLPCHLSGLLWTVRPFYG